MDTSGWVNAKGEPATTVFIVQDPPGSKLVQVKYPAAPNISALAGQVADVAAAQWRKNSPTLPEPADLKLLLQTTLDALITPNFDTYDKFLTSRDAKLMPYLAASADNFHMHNDLGVPPDEWPLFSSRQKSSAYWNAVDARGARWKNVELDSLYADSGIETIRHIEGAGMNSAAVYQAPGGTELADNWRSGQAPVAHVQFPAILTAGKGVLTFIFGYDPQAKRWYPYWLMQNFDPGQGCSLRI